ncbi:hypothetical protein [Streptomyces sp. KMM 9044]|uniref:hypothetical protein n=1 Tax=Streptomyces sp. KMM 9044 TaxID=2744474 RepID=UPI002150D4AF|nr:hypothetical protein [Streptomyces sp. KMM 9044]WAX79983.1 hypothetical protein HUV60_022250 [Streptomyces sp. KMM 9044]
MAGVRRAGPGGPGRAELLEDGGTTGAVGLDRGVAVAFDYADMRHVVDWLTQPCGADAR